MNFHQPETIANAVALLSANEDARCLAGGATLVAMINAELLMPATLVSLNRIGVLVGITECEGGYRIGAMTTHHQLATEARFKGGHRVVRSAAGQIAHPGVRRMGTIGGSIAHADLAADFPSALVAANAHIEITGKAVITAADLSATPTGLAVSDESVLPLDNVSYLVSAFSGVGGDHP